jgi:hypothetical protein
MGCTQNNVRYPDIDMNFDDPQPGSEQEREMLEMILDKLSKGGKLLGIVSDYEGCDGLIREALSNPGDGEVEANAWTSVKKAVEKLLRFYNYSLNIDELWPTIVSHLTEDPNTVIANEQSVMKQISILFHFIFNFDLKKMMNPHIQNDFAYYRRVLSRMKNNKEKKKLSVNDDLANKMSFFFAYPTPMMKVLIDSTTQKVKDDNKEDLITALSLLANASLKAVRDILGTDDPAEHKDNAILFLCTITGCVILVDHLDQRGVFHSKSPVLIKLAVETIFEFREIENTDFLLNSLRFTTLHLNDETTISAVKRILVT